jgi:light-regulated signal transduction histidine kinase (bacteriophytochrome)
LSNGFPPVDLTNCDREPIHILGAIQPFGFLLALSSDWLVTRGSANIERFCGRPVAELIGLPIAAILRGDAVHNIRNRLTMLRGEDVVERLFACRLFEGDESSFDLAVHFSRGEVVIEAEPSAHGEASEAGGMVRSMMSRLDGTGSTEAFFREGARQIRALTGFDRVMVYRFDQTGAGEVIAEAVRSGLGSFHGLRYPASDIPKQARELYLRNLFRIIADVDAVPVPIVPATNERGQPLDLSLSILRAVSPIHVEYLHNMGVRASLSISIVVEGKLWGLFACHHYMPRRPGFERRTVAELFGQMFAMKLESRLRQEAAEYDDRARAASDRLLAQVAGDAALLDDPLWLADTLRDTIPCDGVGVWINGRLALAGMTPDQAEFARLVRALNGTTAGEVLARDRIGDILPAADAYAERAAGLIAIPISRSPRDYVVLFRQEAVRSVRWAGEPQKRMDYGPNGPRLSPRESFAEWSETVRGRSLPFTEAERRVAERLRSALIEVVLRLSDQAHAERERAAERQELLIAELNHRVRNILSLIRGLVRQTAATAASVQDHVHQVDGRIQALARAHNQITEDRWGPASLRHLLETEAAAYLAGKAERVVAVGPEVLLEPTAFSTLALVFHELITNSAKYGGLSDNGRVSVTWAVDDDGDLRIDWRESGGPAVQAPKREGFGSTIINRSIPYDLQGSADVQFKLAGLEARFCIPARHVSLRQEAGGHHARVGPQGADPAAAPPSPRPALHDSMLLLEDSLIIALDAEDILLGIGVRRVISAATVKQALVELAGELPDAAILDINVGDGTSFPVADVLRARGVPFLFATGYGEQAQLPPEHEAVPVLQKPYNQASLAEALAGLDRR